MKKHFNVYGLPTAPNACDQTLREVARTDKWTMAHVKMNPGASSRLHYHNTMSEIYAILRGTGQLIIGSTIYNVKPGNVIEIPKLMRHEFINSGDIELEHLVLATPPFDPADVHWADHGPETYLETVDAKLPPLVDCFDGAKIMAYEFPAFDLSMAFGYSSNDKNRRHPPHYHNHTTEWMYVVEGRGSMNTKPDPASIEFHLKPGDWVEIPPGEPHGLVNYDDQDLMVLCLCQPKFDENDIHHR